MRDVVRELQSLRKRRNLVPGEILQESLTIRGANNTIIALREKEDYIKKETSLAKLKLTEDESVAESAFFVEESN